MLRSYLIGDILAQQVILMEFINVFPHINGSFEHKCTRVVSVHLKNSCDAKFNFAEAVIISILFLFFLF